MLRGDSVEWNELKTLDQGTKITNKPALMYNEYEDVIVVEFLCFDVKHNQVIVRLDGINRFSTIKQNQAKYWELTKEN